MRMLQVTDATMETKHKQSQQNVCRRQGPYVIDKGDRDCDEGQMHTAECHPQYKCSSETPVRHVDALRVGA